MLTASSRDSARVPATASSSPSSAPLHDRTMPSVSICATSRPAPGAERRPDRDLLLPRRRAREQQVRQVGADDQHDHRRPRPRAPTPPGGSARSTWSASGLTYALEAVALRMLPGHLRAERPRSPPALRPPVTPGFRRPIIAIVLPQRLVSGLSGNGKIQIEMAARREHGREVERRRQDADHGVWLVVEGQRRCRRSPDRDLKRRSHSPWLEQHGLRARSTRLSSGVNDRPSCGLHAEHVEEVLRHRDAAESLRLASSRSAGCRRRRRTRSSRQSPRATACAPAGPACAPPASSGPRAR